MIDILDFVNDSSDNGSEKMTTDSELKKWRWHYFDEIYSLKYDGENLPVAQVCAIKTGDITGRFMSNFSYFRYFDEAFEWCEKHLKLVGWLPKTEIIRLEKPAPTIDEYIKGFGYVIARHSKNAILKTDGSVIIADDLCIVYNILDKYNKLYPNSEVKKWIEGK